MVALTGGLVLIGWLFDIARLKSVYADITMKPNAAVALVLAGASLWILNGPQKYPQRVFGEICAVTIALIGLLTLSEHVVGWDLHIDQLLFTEPPGAQATASPGRMGVTASSCFVIFGTSLLLLYRRKAFSLAQLLSMVAGFWALLAMIGYAYGAHELFGIARYTAIALHTAVALFALCLGILAASVKEGFVSIASDQSAAGIMARRLALIAVSAPFLMGWLRLWGQHAGYFDLGFGSALFVSAIIVTLLLAIWRVVVKQKYLDQQRKQSEAIVSDERQKAEQAQALLAGIVESSEDAIISKSLDGIIGSWNAAAERLFEYTAPEAIGKPITMIIPPDRLDEETMIIGRLRRGERIEHFETVRVTKTGKQIDISLTVSPMRNQHDQIVGASKIVRDITDRRNVEREREQLLLQERTLRAEAERVARIKDEFLATVSHELRTPLTAILGWSTMLRSGRLEDVVAARGIEAIERNAKSQAQLIEDLLDVSRIISGKLRLELKPIALTAVVSAAMDSVQLAADAKEIQLRVIVDPSADHVKGDAARLQQVVWNLLSNSIKFTPKGGSVVVKIDRVGSLAQMTVTDTGDGISAEFLPYVFDRFKQADGSTTRKHGGLGLGLAIARHLIEMHGGTIEANSAGHGLGATFTISLPLSIASTVPVVFELAGGSDARIDSAAAVAKPNLQGIRILAVDDETDARDMLRLGLEGFGADVTSAASVQEALDSLLTWRPDVLVSDIGMPGRDGYDLIKRVRALPSEQGGDVPAIALTGYVRIEERMRALAEGFQMFVPKPVEIGELAAVISSLVGTPE